MRKLILPFAFFFILTACGHHRDVRPGAKNRHSISVQGEDEGENARNAVAQAQHFCKEQDKNAVVDEESSKYVGSMDEGTYKTVKGASKAASRVGGAIFMGGNKNSYRDGQNVKTGAGALGDIAGEGYVTQMKFHCE